MPDKPLIDLKEHIDWARKIAANMDPVDPQSARALAIAKTKLEEAELWLTLVMRP